MNKEMTMSFKGDNSGQVLAYCDTGLAGRLDRSSPSPVLSVYALCFTFLRLAGLSRFQHKMASDSRFRDLMPTLA